MHNVEVGKYSKDTKEFAIGRRRDRHVNAKNFDEVSKVDLYICNSLQNRHKERTKIMNESSTASFLHQADTFRDDNFCL